VVLEALALIGIETDLTSEADLRTPALFDTPLSDAGGAASLVPGRTAAAFAADPATRIYGAGMID
jgi:hypothetical protein